MRLHLHISSNLLCSMYLKCFGEKDMIHTRSLYPSERGRKIDVDESKEERPGGKRGKKENSACCYLEKHRGKGEKKKFMCAFLDKAVCGAVCL